MRQALDKQAVKDWLAGQRAAAKRVKTERVRFLLTLTPKLSLQIYLDLWNQVARVQHASPSPLLVAMRRVLARAAQEKGRRP